ncbi:MAG TPA: BON domain-containing protein [Longimicrobium sp.]|nr:BON domain-containing protein [Longimicrobium sp.]
MARNDAGYRRGGQGDGLGRGFRPGPDGGWDPRSAARAAYTPGGFGARWEGRGEYDGDFRPQRGYGGGEERLGDFGGEREESVYGPARYGLGPYYRRLRERRRPDEELRQEVEDALFYDTWVDAEAITVEVAEGVVTLRGDLPDYEEVRYATDDAWDVDGVRGVRSELRVDPSKRKPLDHVGGGRPSQSRDGNG